MKRLDMSWYKNGTGKKAKSVIALVMLKNSRVKKAAITETAYDPKLNHCYQKVEQTAILSPSSLSKQRGSMPKRAADEHLK